MRRKMLRVIIALVAAIAATATVVATPSPAYAALPTCNHWTNFLVEPTPYSPHVPIPTTQANNANSTCALRYGDNTWGVYILQVALNKCHRAGLVQDAVYGPLTRNAVIWMQAAAGIVADGVYGPQTRRYALRWPGYRNNSFQGCYRSPV